MFWLLAPDTVAYRDVGSALFSAFALLLGDFDSDLYVQSPVKETLFIVFAGLQIIVLLNALIAIMSDTYDRVQETAKEQGLLQRARLLVGKQAQANGQRGGGGIELGGN